MSGRARRTALSKASSSARDLDGRVKERLDLLADLGNHGAQAGLLAFSLRRLQGSKNRVIDDNSSTTGHFNSKEPGVRGGE
jgi:hypothetical protein